MNLKLETRDWRKGEQTRHYKNFYTWKRNLVEET